MSGPATSVIAVEYSRLRHGSLEILKPGTYGQELAEAKTAGSAGCCLLLPFECAASTIRAWRQRGPVSLANTIVGQV